MIKAGKGVKKGGKYQRYQCTACGYILISDEPLDPLTDEPGE